MDHLNFIFTKNGFHIDEVNDSAWAELFKENKYAALYELGFKNNLKGLTASAFYLYQLSQKFIEVLKKNEEERANQMLVDFENNNYLFLEVNKDRKKVVASERVIAREEKAEKQAAKKVPSHAAPPDSAETNWISVTSRTHLPES